MQAYNTVLNPNPYSPLAGVMRVVTITQHICSHTAEISRSWTSFHIVSCSGNMQFLLMTSPCVVQKRSRSHPLPLDKATKWLNVETFMFHAPTATDPPISNRSPQRSVLHCALFSPEQMIIPYHYLPLKMFVCKPWKERP